MKKPRTLAKRAQTLERRPIVTHECEADVSEGLEDIAWRELKTLFEDRIESSLLPKRPGALRFQYTGNLWHLLRLRTAQAVYLVEQYDIPRPKALLGDQHFKRLLDQIARVRDLSPADAYRTLRLSAAGSDSAVMTRLRDELAIKLGLTPDDREGDLLIRLRRIPQSEAGWETLVRLSPRPLAARAWRVCNREGALNAAVAQAMVMLTQPTPDDTFLNIMCGSGTLLIERAAYGPAASLIGYDHDPTALECARRNVEAAGYTEQIRLRQADARDLTLADKSVDVICGDLPFGNLVGSHEGNLELYPAVLRELARIARPGARAALISQEVRLLEGLLDESPHWEKLQAIRVALGGLHPRIFLLKRA